LVQKGLEKELADKMEEMEIDGKILKELCLKDLLDTGMTLGRAKTIMRTVDSLKNNSENNNASLNPNDTDLLSPNANPAESSEVVSSEKN